MEIEQIVKNIESEIRAEKERYEKSISRYEKMLEIAMRKAKIEKGNNDSLQKEFDNLYLINSIKFLLNSYE